MLQPSDLRRLLLAGLVPYLRHSLLAVLIIALGFALRLQSAGGDLWLDEIWSLNFAQSMTAWHEAFWRVFHDNNHPLNTLYLYLVGPERDPWQYRMASVISGTLSVVAAGWAVARGGPERVLMAMLLTAVLYPLVHFGSEARGYASMILFSFIAFGAVDRAKSETSAYRWLFALAVGLGAWSHLSILPVAFSMTVAFMFRALENGDGFFPSIHKTLRFGAPSAGVLSLIGGLLIYGAQTNHGKPWLGGPPWPCPEQGCYIGAWDDILHFSAGRIGADYAPLHSGLFFVFMIGGFLLLFKRANPRVALYLCIWVVVTVLYLAMGQPNAAFARYILPIFAFVPLFTADVGAELRGSPSTLRGGFAVIVFLFIAMNAWSVMEFQKDRRGQYLQIYDLITQNTPSNDIVIAVNYPFRFQTVIDYVNRKTPERRFEYVPAHKISEPAPLWFVVVGRDKARAEKELCLKRANYQLVKSFEHWGFSGSHWDVYRLNEKRSNGCVP